MKKNLKWSKDEIEALKRLYPQYISGNITWEEMQEVFCNRTKNAIMHKAEDLRLSNLEFKTFNEKKYKELLKRIKI